MSCPVVGMRPNEPVARAKNLMLRHRIKRLVIVEKGCPVGIVSMKDLAERLGRGASAWRRRPIDLIPVARVMSTGLITISPHTSLDKAAQMLLRHGISSLVVTEGKRLVGILTKTDLTRFFAGQLKERARLRALMTTQVATANRRHSLAHVVELMEKNNVGRVVIVDRARPIGIVTASDVAFAQLETPAEGVPQRRVRFTRRADRATRPRYRYIKYISLLTAEDVMKPDLLTVDANEDVAKAAGLMLKSCVK